MLTDNQIQIRNAARDFAQGSLASQAAQRDRTGHADRSMLDGLAALGYLGMLLPEEFGGAGMDYVSYALAISEIAAAGGACSTTASVHNSLAFATEAAERICSDAMQTLGGNGYLADYPLERIYRDVRVCTIYEGTSDIQRLVISRQIADQMAHA